MSDLYSNKESDYSQKNTSDIEYFRSTIFQPFQFEPGQKKTFSNKSHEKGTTETKHIHASAANLLHIRIGNLDWDEIHEKETKHIHA